MSNRQAAASVVFAAVLSAVMLTGCTDPAPQAAETTAAARPTAEPRSDVTPTPTPTADPGGCEQRSQLGFMQGDGVDGHWVFWIGPDLVDRGPTESTNGTVTKDGDGRILSYTVADGDGDFAIGDRFCLEPYSFMKYSDLGPALQPGDVLMLAVAPADLFESKP